MIRTVSHQEQQKIWEEEHSNPYILPPMDSCQPSSGLVLFWQWQKDNQALKQLQGLEIGCGKGRNSI